MLVDVDADVLDGLFAVVVDADVDWEILSMAVHLFMSSDIVIVCY